LTLTLLAASAGLLAQNSSSNFYPSLSSALGAGQSTASPVSKAAVNASPAPFSRLALSGGIGANGINMRQLLQLHGQQRQGQRQRRIERHRRQWQTEFRYRWGHPRLFPVPEPRLPFEPRLRTSQPERNHG
jgi:hypothetical protein